MCWWVRCHSFAARDQHESGPPGLFEWKYPAARVDGDAELPVETGLRACLPVGRRHVVGHGDVWIRAAVGTHARCPAKNPIRPSLRHRSVRITLRRNGSTKRWPRATSPTARAIRRGPGRTTRTGSPAGTSRVGTSPVSVGLRCGGPVRGDLDVVDVHVGAEAVVRVPPRFAAPRAG